MKGVMRFNRRENLDPDMLDLIEYPKELTMYPMSRDATSFNIASSEILYFYIKKVHGLSFIYSTN